MSTTSKERLNSVHIYLLVLIRVAIGWLFLYEGITKIIAVDWSAAPYLAGQDG
jgi:uncharacterized membrane protein YphA (DoxX/SURF4 family)